MASSWSPAELVLLLQASAAGDDRAAAKFVRATQPTIMRVCRALGSGFDVDDLVNETYLRALRSSSSFDGVSSPLGWLVTIARRVCADEVRRATRRRAAAEIHQAKSASDTATPSELRQLIDALAPERREAFLLTAVAGFSYDEAAAMLACPVGTIRSRVSRARADLVAAHRAAEAV